MPSFKDGPSTDLFTALSFKGNVSLAGLAETGLSAQMSEAVEHAPSGACVGWGIPFEIGDVVVIQNSIVAIDLPPTVGQWLVFMHTSDHRQVQPTRDGFFAPMRGQGQLGERAADYVILYQDGTEERVVIRRRHQIGPFERRWGENCFEAVAHTKPHPVRGAHEQPRAGWGWSQMRVAAADSGPWINWLWAWENPHPDKVIGGIRFEPVSGTIIVAAISAGRASSLPIRWQARCKAVLALPDGEAFDPKLDEQGLLSQVQLDMGQVISATPRLLYANDRWPETYNNQIPEPSGSEVLIEYTAHPDAHFHLSDGSRVPVAQVEGSRSKSSLCRVPPARRRVTLRAV
jgi:hypothetical protein